MFQTRDIITSVLRGLNLTSNSDSATPKTPVYQVSAFYDKVHFFAPNGAAPDVPWGGGCTHGATPVLRGLNLRPESDSTPKNTPGYKFSSIKNKKWQSKLDLCEFLHVKNDKKRKKTRFVTFRDLYPPNQGGYKHGRKNVQCRWPKLATNQKWAKSVEACETS